MTSQTETEHEYFVPTPVPWPLIMNMALMLVVTGLSLWFNGLSGVGSIVFYIGVALTLAMFFMWFRGVINESLAGAYSGWEDRTFRYGMMWFIFSEVMFFAALFGALFYTRLVSVPWLSGAGTNFYTHFYLWPHFAGGWPTNGPLNVGGDFTAVTAWRLPLLNTILLLISAVTLTWAHRGLKANRRLRFYLGIAASVVLGIAFLYIQGMEYSEAYHELGLTLGAGVYGSTYFLLTGFHGLHVTLGVIMLIVILLRALKGHFTPADHFGVEGVVWYWYFIYVLWLCVFVFVYVL